MYLQHYRLQSLPFRNTPDPRFFFETPRHNEALANLIYAVEQRRGFVLLSGEIGSGKTLVTHLLLQHLEDRAQIALIRNTHLNSSQLIRLVCDEFSVQVSTGADKASMLMALNGFLVQQLTEDRLVVIIIDEAQNLSDKVMEELRMLSNLETSTEKLLQIVLVGQPELRDKVSQPHLEQLRQRIALAYHLEPLTLEEVAQYIAHRLKVASEGAAGGAEGGHLAEFTAEAVEKIARHSRGTPRVINGLCDNALLYGFTSNTRTIDEDLIERVLRQSMHVAGRPRAPAASWGHAAATPMPRGRRNPAEAAEAPRNPPRPNPREEPRERPHEEVRPAPLRPVESAAVEGATALEFISGATAPAEVELVPMEEPAMAGETQEAGGVIEFADKKKEEETVLVPPIIAFPTLHLPTSAVAQ